MQKIFHIFLLSLAVTLLSQAATRGDIKVIEASENIRYLSQKLVKEYLFFYKYPEQVEMKNKLEKLLLKMNDDFRIIATTTKDSDTKDILEFLAYSKDQIEQIFNEKPDSEKAALMLDYSETLLEGTDSIASAHMYDFSDEEKMLMRTKKMEYLLERITKYYMALNVGFDNTTNKESMQESINGFEENIKMINAYKYPLKQVREQVKMNISWEANKVFFAKSKDLFIPKLMFISVDYLESIVSQIALYHSKNQ
ncbi:MAG TPA: hypothetical protein EYG94_08945 [Campylobacterales bacterium]|nr:hypothetical protein [Sulfurimonas autotrophica]HIP52199.1 hypothetical protein [Campylobacterales bacterium]